MHVDGIQKHSEPGICCDKGVHFSRNIHSDPAVYNNLQQPCQKAYTVYNDDKLNEVLPKLGACEAILCWPGGRRLT